MRIAAGQRRTIVSVLFLVTLACVFYFALTPNVRGDVLSILPVPVRSWCGRNDDLANFALFAILGCFGFYGQYASSKGRKPLAGTRLITLLLLVVSLELVQLWIPGRFSTVRDIVTGSSGVVLAWVVSQLQRRRNVQKSVIADSRR